MLSRIRGSHLAIVGAGLFGLTIARLAAEDDFRVFLIDKRDHLGGNSFSTVHSETGIEYHPYGTHIFHTSNEKVWKFVNRFGNFNNYTHFVISKSRGEFFSMPPNLSTLNKFYGVQTPEEARAKVAQLTSQGNGRASNLEEKAISLVGKEIYERLIRGYTWKQWGRDPAELPDRIITRLPFRFNHDFRYFSDSFEGIPIQGYGDLVAKMATHPNIDYELGVDYFDQKADFAKADVPMVYTGPIDKFFDFKFGPLDWRTVDFQFEVKELVDFQGAAVVNYPDLEIPFTRIHEFKHLHPEREIKKSEKTLIAYETSRATSGDDEAHYPVNSKSDREKLELYRLSAKNLSGVFFGGRLGSYQYLDMHMAIASAMTMYEIEVFPLLENLRRRENG